MLFRIAHGTATTQAFWCCDNTNTGGQLGVKIDGGSIETGDTVGSTTNYCGLVTATGLTAGQTYAYQLTLGGSDVAGASGTFRALPASGTVNLLFCGDHASGGLAHDTLIARETGIDACFWQEWDYLDEGQYEGSPVSAGALGTLRAAMGGNTAAYLPVGDPDYATHYGNFLTSYRLKYRANTGQPNNRWRREFDKRFRSYHMWGNHGCYSLDASPWMPAPETSQYDAAYRAFWEYRGMGNPTGTVADPDSVPDPLSYFAVTIGNAEILVCDTVSYADTQTAQLFGGTTQTNVLGGGRGEGKQLAWIKDRIDNTTAKFLLIYSGGRIQNNTEWTDASDGIFKHLNDRAIAAAVIVPDIHQLYARYLSGSAIRMPDRGILEIGCSPLAHPLPADFTTFTGNSQTLFQDNRVTTVASLYSPGAFLDHSYGYLKAAVEADRVTFSIHNALTGATRWSGTLLEGARVPV